MRLEIVTIVLNGMPWIACHWPQFERLPFPWRWHVVEGAAANRNCTSWCAEIIPQLSNDGTSEYLNALAGYDPRVLLYRKELWNGKVAMMNEPLRAIAWPCLLLQADSDELWTAEQLISLREMFMASPSSGRADFFCDYKLGRNISIASRGGFGNHTEYEWRRAWRRNPGQYFSTHEPPVLDRCQSGVIPHAITAKNGLIFRHEAYSTEAQMRFKEAYYGSPNNPNGHLYNGCVEGWKRLQLNTTWPVTELADFLPWVGKGVVAEKKI